MLALAYNGAEASTQCKHCRALVVHPRDHVADGRGWMGGGVCVELLFLASVQHQEKENRILLLQRKIKTQNSKEGLY